MGKGPTHVLWGLTTWGTQTPLGACQSAGCEVRQTRTSSHQFMTVEGSAGTVCMWEQRQ